MNRAALGVVLVLLAGAVATGNASHGGPTVTEVIGFDPSAGRLYYVARGHSESWEYPQILFLEIVDGSVSAPRLYPVATPVEPRLEDGHAAVESVVDSLRLTCIPPTLLDPSAFHVSPDTLAERYFSDTDFDLKRQLFVIRARVSGPAASGTTVLAAFCNGTIRLSQAMRFQQLDWIAVKLTYTGIPIETCYERDELVVLQPGGS